MTAAPAAADGFAAALRAAAEPAWSQAVQHRFVRELAADTIDDAAYARYLVLDYGFIETLVGLVGHAVGTAPGMAAKTRYAQFLSVLTSEENDYFLRAFRALEVPEARWQAPPDHPVLRGFRELMGAAARSGDYARILSVLLPVEWIYLSWASAARDSRPGRFYLAEWIDLHVEPAFADFVAWMGQQLDATGAVLGERDKAELTAAFCRAVELEVAFFDAAYACDD